MGKSRSLSFLRPSERGLSLFALLFVMLLQPGESEDIAFASFFSSSSSLVGSAFPLCFFFTCRRLMPSDPPSVSCQDLHDVFFGFSFLRRYCIRPADRPRQHVSLPDPLESHSTDTRRNSVIAPFFLRHPQPLCPSVKEVFHLFVVDRLIAILLSFFSSSSTLVTCFTLPPRRSFLFSLFSWLCKAQVFSQV